MPALSTGARLRRGLDDFIDVAGQRLARLRPFVAWLLLMVCAVPLTDLLKPVDWQVLDRLQTAPSAWPGNVAIVDLGWNFNPAEMAADRRKLAGTLRALATLDPPPAVVVMDVSISTTPIEIGTLRAAFDALRARGVSMVQVADMDGFAAELDRKQVLKHQGQAELHDYAASYGHSRFEYSEGGTAWYAPCAVIPTLRGDEPCMPAAARLVAEIVAGRNPTADPNPWALPTVLVPGRANAEASFVWIWGEKTGLQPQAGSTASAAAAAAALGRRVVVVGNLKHDRIGPWPGPVLLGWAIGDATALAASERVVLLRRPLWALGLALAFSAITLGLFITMRRLDPRVRWLGATAVATALGSLLLLAGLVLGLRYGLQLAFYQVGYGVLAILATTWVAWRTARAAVIRRALYTLVSEEDPQAPPQWDVFISYSRSPAAHAERVRREVWEPLSRLRTPERELRVFFDEASIRVGTSWFVELADGIERSRCFVALYSGDYFQKSFCRFELRKAMVRDIAVPDEQFVLLPFKLDPGADPPPEFSHVQVMTPQSPGELIEAVRAALAAQGIHTV